MTNPPLDRRRFARIRGEAVALLALGGPLIAAQLAQISMGFVDTVMAGRLSPQDLAAVAVASSLWVPVLIFGMGILMSVSPTVAHAFGAGKYAEIGGHVRQGLWLSQAVGLVSFFVVRNCSPILRWMEIDPAVVPTAAGFLEAISWGIPASCAFTVLRGYSEAVEKTRPVMVISLVGLTTNIVGNSIFMHGRLGMPRLGAIGTGVASACVMWTMLASLVIWLHIDRYYRKFPVFDRFVRPDRSQLWRLVKLGCPIGVCMFTETSMFATVSLLMGRLGADVVAGHQVALNVASVTFMVPLGLSIAATVRVGHAMGRGDARGARRSGLVGAGLACGFMSLTALVMATCPHWIAAVYTNDADVRSMAVRLLVMAAIFQIFDGLQVAGAGALRGLKDTAVPMLITFVAYWGLGLPLGLVLGIYLDGGPQALWIGLIVGLAVAAVLLNMRFVLLTRRLMAAEPEIWEDHGAELPLDNCGVNAEFADVAPDRRTGPD
jgi:MATE family multidrug resistance protein